MGAVSGNYGFACLDVKTVVAMITGSSVLIKVPTIRAHLVRLVLIWYKILVTICLMSIQ